MRFAWDPRKAAANYAKHGVSFDDAITAFSDPLSRTIEDPDHSQRELRFLLIGTSAAGRLLVVRRSMRPEYDFSKGVRGKYVPRMLGTTVVMLDSDVAAIYRDSKAVNAALREHAGLKRKGKRSAARTRSR